MDQSSDAAKSLRRAHSTINHLSASSLNQPSSLLTQPSSAISATIPPQYKTPKYNSTLKKWDTNAMWHLLEHDSHQFKKQVLQFLQDPAFDVSQHDLSMYDNRERTVRQVKKLLSSGLISVAEYKSNPSKFLAFMEKIGLYDCSLGVKTGVHMVLFGGAIMHLGTEKHHQKYIPLIDSFKLPGCFGMTELGHGSNVQGIETTAIYDKSTQEFIINTPTETAQKYWIGGAAQHAQACAVFAQLIVDNVNHGVHVFIVPIRNPDGSIAQNVRIKDNGHKMGLLGVDNGRIWFDNKRIPRDNLLNRFGDVAADGTYTSTYDNPLSRFGAMVAPLVGGRVSIAVGALGASKVSLYIAVKYSLQRKQFGKTGAEIPIISYLTQQRRLCPAVACTYLYSFGVNYVKDKYFAPKDSKELHILASGFKAIVTWFKTETVQACRECCGGQGFSSQNRIGELKADTEIDMTYEGDNHVLLQQMGRSLLTSFQKGKIALQPSMIDVPVTKVESLDFLLGAMKWRETHLLQELANRIISDISNLGMKGTAAFCNHLDMVTALGRACVERVSLEKMLLAMNEQREKQPEIFAALLPLAKLAALWRIEKDLGYFVTYGGINSEMADAVLKQVNVLCREVAMNIENYVDSFQLPEHVVRAPIAYDYIEYNKYSHPNDHVNNAIQQRM